MKLIPFLLFICINLFSQKISSQEIKQGGLKLNLIDSLGQSVNLKFIKIIVDENIELTPKLKETNISSLSLISGLHSIQIQTEKFKNVLVTDVKIYEQKLSFIEITLKEKTSENDTSIVKLKYEEPKKTICN